MNTLQFEIPWKNDEKPVVILEGTPAIVPVLDEQGIRTGEFTYLSHDDYVKAMGSRAIVVSRISIKGENNE